MLVTVDLRIYPQCLIASVDLAPACALCSCFVRDAQGDLVGLVQVEELPTRGSGTVLVPLLGTGLCAGFPSPADDFLEGALELPRWLVPNPPATFLMQVRGDSMRRAGIFDRDLAAIDRSLSPVHESVVVAVVAGQLSIKRYRIVGNTPRLAFDSEELPAFDVDEVADVEIWGVTRFTIRWHVARAGLGR